MILKKGSKGDKVRQLQLALGITADGIFGSAKVQLKSFKKNMDFLLMVLSVQKQWICCLNRN